METYASLLESIQRIGTDIASQFADDVDKESRFPSETLAALKEGKYLSAGVARELGGAGLNIEELASLCANLGQHCSASAMILAMHYIQVGSIAEHCKNEAPWLDYLRSLANEQRLIASVTSEEGVGGEMRRSIAGVESTGNTFKLFKKATTISYGAYAADLLITARRNTDAAANDQVLVLALKGNFTITEAGTWDTFGMRGTCSAGGHVTAEGETWQVMSENFANIAGETMVPHSHILWAALWLGIATDALNRTRTLVRKSARKQRGEIPVATHELTRIYSQHQAMRDGLFGVIREYQDLLKTDREQLLGMAFGIRINNLKLDASQHVVSIVSQAMQLAGVMAYKIGTPFSLGRHLRDANSAVLMIHNQRIVEANASMQLVLRGNSDRQQGF